MVIDRQYLFNRLDECHRIVANSKLDLNRLLRIINIVGLYKLPNFLKRRLHLEIIRYCFSLILPQLYKLLPVLFEIFNHHFKYLWKTKVRVDSLFYSIRKGKSFCFIQFVEISVKRQRYRWLSHNLLCFIYVEVIPSFVLSERFDEATFLRIAIVLGSQERMYPRWISYILH